MCILHGRTQMDGTEAEWEEILLRVYPVLGGELRAMTSDLAFRVRHNLNHTPTHLGPLREGTGAGGMGLCGKVRVREGTGLYGKVRVREGTPLILNGLWAFAFALLCATLVDLFPHGGLGAPPSMGSPCVPQTLL
jgi:hypothetical protein